MAELTQNEKRLLTVLGKEKKGDAVHIASLLDATPEATVQWAYLAQDKDLATVTRIVTNEYVHTEEGKEYLKNGLPETQLLKIIKPGSTLSDLQKSNAFKIGFGQLRKKGLVTVNGTQVSAVPGASTDAVEELLRNPSATDPRTKELIKRGITQGVRNGQPHDKHNFKGACTLKNRA